jgi:hypothetical protein
MPFDLPFNIRKPTTDWKSSSTLVEDIQFDAAFIILKQLGIRGRGIARTYYPLVQPELRPFAQSRYAGYLATAQLVGCERTLLPYFRDVLRLCHEHAGRVDQGTYLRTEAILFRGREVIARPWISMKATDPESHSHRLDTTKDGVLLFEPDQAETEEIHGVGNQIYYHFFDSESKKPLVNIHFPRERFQTQFRDAEARLTTIVAVLCRELGVPSWESLVNSSTGA